MIKRIDIGSSAFRFHTWPDQNWYLPWDNLFAKTRRFQDQRSAEAFLEQLSEAPGALDSLNTLVASSAQFLRPWKRRDKREIIEDAAKCILSSDIQVVDLGWQPPKPCWIPSAPKPTPKAKEDSTAAPKRSSFAVKFVWADNGDPVEGIAMSVQTPEGNSFSRTTNSEGKVTVDTAEEGLCALSCSFSRVKLTEVVVFAGEGDVPEAERTEAATEQRPESVLTIVNVTAHRVRTGETLAQLAQAVGLAWKELAYFNWGTESPDEINKHLRKDVGCTKKTEDGKDYRFDDRDEPGIIYLPRTWSLKGLATDGSYTIRVSGVREHLPRQLRVCLDIDPNDLSSSDDKYTLIGGKTRECPEYQQTKTSKDDVVKEDKYTDLIFTGLVAGLNYWLEIDPGKDGDKYYAFENLPWESVDKTAKKA